MIITKRDRLDSPFGREELENVQNDARQTRGARRLCNS